MGSSKRQKYTYHSNRAGGRGKKPARGVGKRPESSRSSSTQRRRPRQKRQSIPVAVIVVLIFFVVIAYIVNAAVSLSNKVEIPSVTIQMGNLDVPVLLNGIIIRDEKVYTAPMAGVVNYNYNDLDKIKKGATVCAIYNEQAVDELAGDIDEINKAILRMQDRRSEISAFKNDVDNVNQQIKTIIDNKALLSLQTDFSAVLEIKDSIAQNLSLRNQILLNESRGSLSSLASDKQHYENELNKNYTNVMTGESGILSYIVDGLEESLTIDRMYNITSEETRMTVDYDRLVRDRNVEKDEDVFKVLLSNEWYIAAYMPMEMVAEWAEGETRTIYIQQRTDFLGIDMKIEKLTPGEKETYVLFKSTKNVLDYIHMRSVKFKISNSEHKGYKIPTSAIVEQTLLKVPREYTVSGDSLSVIRHTELADEKIPINVRDQDEDYVYVSQEISRLVLHDELKLPEEPYTIYEISDVVNVKGVYMINRGYAEFKKIALAPGMPVTGDYVILDPETNKELRIHDRIISDARTVTEQQKVVE